MKAIFISIALLVLSGVVSAQTKFGILTYVLPAGWQITKQSPSVMLEKQQIQKSANPCKLELLQTENIVVNTAKGFLSQVSAKTAFGEKFDASTVNRTEANGTICYGIMGTVTLNLKSMNCYFYSITNGSQTTFVRFIKGEDNCSVPFQQFWSAMLVDGSDAPVTLNARRKSVPAGPAAPAPVM